MVRTEALLTWDASAPLEDGAPCGAILDPPGDCIFVHLPLCPVPRALI